jgi:hypothetical protein
MTHTTYKNIKVGEYYLSNNPCFPGQIFYVEKVGVPEIRFTKEDSIVEYVRLAYSFHRNGWYVVEKTKAWVCDNFGVKVPENLTKEVSHLV